MFDIGGGGCVWGRLQRAASKPLVNRTWLLEVENGRCGNLEVLMGGVATVGVTASLKQSGRKSKASNRHSVLRYGLGANYAICHLSPHQTWGPGQDRVWMGGTQAPRSRPLNHLLILFRRKPRSEETNVGE